MAGRSAAQAALIDAAKLQQLEEYTRQSVSWPALACDKHGVSVSKTSSGGVGVVDLGVIYTAQAFDKYMEDEDEEDEEWHEEVTTAVSASSENAADPAATDEGDDDFALLLPDGLLMDDDDDDDANDNEDEDEEEGGDYQDEGIRFVEVRNAGPRPAVLRRIVTLPLAENPRALDGRYLDNNSNDDGSDNNNNGGGLDRRIFRPMLAASAASASASAFPDLDASGGVVIPNDGAPVRVAIQCIKDGGGGGGGGGGAAASSATFQMRWLVFDFRVDESAGQEQQQQQLQQLLQGGACGGGFSGIALPWWAMAPGALRPLRDMIAENPFFQLDGTAHRFLEGEHGGGDGGGGGGGGGGDTPRLPLPTMLGALETDLRKICGDGDAAVLERMVGAAFTAAFDAHFRRTDQLAVAPSAANGAAGGGGGGGAGAAAAAAGGRVLPPLASPLLLPRKVGKLNAEAAALLGKTIEITTQSGVQSGLFVKLGNSLAALTQVGR